VGYKVSPPKIYAKVGQNVTFNCISNKKVTWKKRVGSIKANVLMTSKKLSIINVRKSNAGKYFCEDVEKDYSCDVGFGHLYVKC